MERTMSFNEAGAGCPGIRLRDLRRRRRGGSFNEAGAGCPGILGFEDPDRPRGVASMRPGQAAPVFEQPEVRSDVDRELQ